MASYSHSYEELSGYDFLIAKSQKEMFVELRTQHPDIFQALLEAVEEKNKKSRWQTLVTIYGDFNNGHCPTQLNNMEDFGKFSSFYVHTRVAPQQHNTSWITESISVIGTF